MNINEKLNKIFYRKDFRVEDIVNLKAIDCEFFLSQLFTDDADTEWKIQDITGTNGYLITNYKHETIWCDKKDLTLIQPAVTLSDVLVKMNEKRVVYGIVLPIYEPTFKEMTIEVKERRITNRARWILDKDLWHQSNVAKKFIAEILE